LIDLLVVVLMMAVTKLGELLAVKVQSSPLIIISTIHRTWVMPDSWQGSISSKAFTGPLCNLIGGIQIETDNRWHTHHNPGPIQMGVTQLLGLTNYSHGHCKMVPTLLQGPEG
jgi:hypothetical protein